MKNKYIVKYNIRWISKEMYVVYNVCLKIHRKRLSLLYYILDRTVCLTSANPKGCL